MKIIVTTSDKHRHLMPAFTYLFNKYVGQEEVTVLGYESVELPENFTFHSMGKQGVINEWSTDIRKYVESQEDDWFMWCMEDSFIRAFNNGQFLLACAMMQPHVGRIDLTNDVLKREHHNAGMGIVYASPTSRYRLSTQPALWNKKFLLQYLTDRLDPWSFETQDPVNDDWQIIGLTEPAIVHNEAVRKGLVDDLDLKGFCEEDVLLIKSLL